MRSGEATEAELQPWDSSAHPMAPFFASMRERRREIYAAKPLRRPRRRAMITIVHNEAVFLPLWLGYYGRFFAPGDIYVLDHESTDGSTDRPGFNRIPVEHQSVDHTWMVRRVEALQHELLGSGYELVVVTDVDEIIAPVPACGTLGDYLDRFDEMFVTCLGYELLHRPELEPPLDLERPVLDQRRFWYFNGAYDKAAVATEPMSWRPGFHGRSDYKLNPDPDLRLIHLHRMDYDICLQRHRIRRHMPWAPLDAEKRWAVHNQIVDEAEFARWFSHDSGFEGFLGYTMKVEEIGAMWRGLF